jgi:hypothetical protein
MTKKPLTGFWGFAMSQTENIHPDSPLIDGALPRSNSERVSILLDYALSLLPSKTNFKLAEYRELRLEYKIHEAQEIPHPPLVHPENEWEHWNELEDDVIALINELLPEPWIMTIHPDDPGTVVIWDSNDDDE